MPWYIYYGRLSEKRKIANNNILFKVLYPMYVEIRVKWTITITYIYNN